MTTLQAIQPFTKAEPDKEMKLEKAKVSLYGLPNNTVIAHEMCEPGWKWTTHSKPHSGTDLCHRSHTGFMTKGCLVCQWPDGRKQEIVAGQAFFIPAGHDAWVEGNEPAELFDFTGWAERAQEGGGKVM